MLLRSFNLEVNEYCNSKCVMCNMWQNPRMDIITPKSLENFLQGLIHDIRDVSVTGGEPFLRDDLKQLVDVIIGNVPGLEQLFVNTNGTYPNKVSNFIDYCASKVKELFGCVSLEGLPEVHNKVRGIKGYDLARETLELIAKSEYPNVKAIISTTITNDNQGVENLYHIKEVARELGCEYTFRLADSSSVYYQNEGIESFKPEKTALDDIVLFIKQYKSHDPFLQVLAEFIATGAVPIMGSKDAIICKAGETFTFMDAKGNVRPCIYSTRVIGTVTEGFVPRRIPNLGKYEPCPCCTECTMYPMLIQNQEVKG